MFVVVNKFVQKKRRFYLKVKLSRSVKMNEAFDQIEPIFNQFKGRSNTEFEIRLGKKSQKTFDTNVGKDVFEKILRGLNKYQGWESVKKINETVYYKDDIRVCDNEDTGESRTECKKKLKKHDIKLTDSPFDIRFCVSSESKCEKPEDATFDDMRVKHRTSFIRKNLSIDVTHVTGDPDDPDSENADTYEIELEIIDPKKVTNSSELCNIVYKVFDILKLV